MEAINGFRKDRVRNSLLAQEFKAFKVKRVAFNFLEFGGISPDHAGT